MQIIRNIPIACPRCNTQCKGQEREVKQSKKIVTECNWRCFNCGTFIKHGITNVKDI